MTRPKVDPDKRQRTAQACDSCKRRKQKCNGLKPCSTCMKRSLECLYTPTSMETGSQEPLGSPTKRRLIDNSPRSLKSSLKSGQTIATHTPFLASWDQSTDRSAMSLAETESPESNQNKFVGATRHLLTGNDRDFDSRSRISNASGATDEDDLMSLTRMLMDGTGRLQYVGESASLSYLQLIRMIVETVSGPSNFTIDRQRHNILENVIELPQDARPTGVLPDRKAAGILIESFFINTSGLVDIFHKESFLQSMEECYNNPLGVSQAQLCLLNLVFAVGLIIACPREGTDEETVIKSLHSEPSNRAELFFRNATKLHNPASGFEDENFWSVQALLLMSLYTLAVCRRHTSYVYIGMAVRTAQALGLHREEENIEIFPPPERRLRRNVWRSLFVLDRIVSAILGRPMAISEEDCSGHVFEHPTGAGTDDHVGDVMEVTNSAALDAAVKNCHLIGLTLKKVYSKKMKVSTIVAQEIADHLDTWERGLHRNLHCRRIVEGPISSGRAGAVATLHINLLHCHSVILLTRPFFLYLLKIGCDDFSRGSQKAHRLSSRLEKFAQASVEASQRTIILAQAALDAKYLPQCNPFIIYFVFAAALIVLSNEFASLFHNPDADNSIQSVLRIFEYCKQNDAQANRVYDIVESFRDANKRGPQAVKEVVKFPGRKVPTISTQSHNFQGDPLSSFLHHVKTERHDLYLGALPSVKERQMVNFPSTAPEHAMHPPMTPMLQQPSPEGSVSLNGGIAPTSMAPGAEGLNGDPEFHLETLWRGWMSPTESMGIAPPMHPVETFASYGLHQQPMPQGNSLNPRVPQPYPPPNFH